MNAGFLICIHFTSLLLKFHGANTAVMGYRGNEASTAFLPDSESEIMIPVSLPYFRFNVQILKNQGNSAREQQMRNDVNYL